MSRASSTLTEPQRIASDPAHSAWVFANAGTGKTSVLANRVLRLLLAGVEPSKILCLTFTNAAAAEMELRVKRKLSQWATAEESQLAEDIAGLVAAVPDKTMLRRAQRLFLRMVDSQDNLRIQTIHAFCQSLLKRFPLEAGVSSHLALMDEKTARELVREAWLRLISDHAGIHLKDKKSREALQKTAQLFADTTLTSLIDEAINARGELEELLSAHHDIEVLIDAMYAVLNTHRNTTEKNIIDRYITNNNNRIKDIMNVIGVNHNTTLELAGWLDLPPEMAVAAFPVHQRIFLTAGGTPRVHLFPKKLYDAHPELEKLALDTQNAVLETVEHLNNLGTAKCTEHFLRLVGALLALYRQLKDQRALLDYDDLIHYSYRLVTRQGMMPWVMYKLDEGIDHILVDEAQDTSAPQWKIIEALCSEFFAGEGRVARLRSLFVVGDLKQSIFSFQGAEPALFSGMHRSFRKDAAAAGKPWHSVALEMSFRSTPPILQAVDAILTRPEMQAALGEAETIVKHIPHRSGARGVVELWPLASVPEDVSGKQADALPVAYTKKQDAKKILAEKIASSVRGWLDEKRVLSSTGKPITPGDIMILVRQRRDTLTGHILRALAALHIPVAGIDRIELTEHIAVMDMLALGHFLLLPEDDLTLAALLKSPLCGMNDEELFTLAYSRGGASLWQMLREKSRENDRMMHVFRDLSELLRQVDFTSPFALFAEVLEVRGGRKAFIARMGGEVEDVLNEFLNLAMQYTQSHTPSLQGFLHWVQSGKTEIKRDMEHGKNEIRVVTVHGAKGLQAPVIFLPDTTQFTPRTPAMLWSDNCVLLPGKQEGRAAICQRLAEEEKQCQQEEYYRLLYVALTRAQDELYICGWESPRRSPTKGCWYEVAKAGLQGIAHEEEDGTLWLVSGASCHSEAKPKDLPPHGILRGVYPGEGRGQDDTPPLPDFFYRPPLLEKASGVILPSRMEEEEDAASTLPPSRDKQRYLRGNATHLLLQHLPGISQDARHQASMHLLSRHLPESSAPAKQEIIREVEAILTHPELVPLFSHASIAEVPVTGMAGDRLVSGQIDRLAVSETEVIIADYKTHRNPPTALEDVPVRYLRQMAAYRHLLQEIYPGKTIRCVLIWTQGARWMELPDFILEPHAPS